MVESQEGTEEAQKLNPPLPAAVSETPNPSGAAAAGNREMKKQTAPERATDKRSTQRHANAMKARAGHRRNIRRSNTNG
jgi:hypothetical protein